MKSLLCIAVAATAASLVASGPAAAAPAAPSFAASPHLVSLNDGRRLNLVCAGRGFPTVIFEQGSGESILDWSKIRKPVSALTRACFYDRAGLGYSDPGGHDATAMNATDDLHALVRAANIERPVVLVGHSLGGLFATLYADRFPSDVAALVLVDTSFATQFDYPISASGKATVESDQRKYIGALEKCHDLAAKRQLAANNTHDCFTLPPRLTTPESGYLLHQYAHPHFYAARLSETENFLPLESWKSVDGIEENAAHRDFGGMPIEVLTAGNPPRNPRKTETDNKSFADWWLEGHEELATRSTRGETITVAQAGHNIQNDQPDAVVKAIEKVLLMLHQERP